MNSPLLFAEHIHRENHSFGDEQAWWSKQAIDAVETSRQLWVTTRRIE
jgi:hypothetical protein